MHTVIDIAARTIRQRDELLAALEALEPSLWKLIQCSGCRECDRMKLVIDQAKKAIRNAKSE